MTATIGSGTIHLAAREVLLDLSLPKGSTLKGKLWMIFDPSTGFYSEKLYYEKLDYPKYSWLDDLASNGRIGISAERLVVIKFSVSMITVCEATSKAGSLDDTETRAVGRYANLLAEIEARSYRPQKSCSIIQLVRGWFPKGFFLSELGVSPSLPVQLVDMVRRDDTHWDVIIESRETHQRATMPIFRAGPMPSASVWSGGFIK